MRTVTSAEDLATQVRRLASEREALTRARDDVTERLKIAVARLLDSGVTETEAATLAGVNRNTVRTWQGKQDYRNHAIRAGQRLDDARDRPA